jgi:hypothetical protein
MLGALICLLVMAGDIWAIVNIVQSNESTGVKTLWVVLVFFLPVLGLGIWYFAGPKAP